MEPRRGGVFDIPAWQAALGTFGAVTHLSVSLFDAQGCRVGDPSPPTALHSLLQAHGYQPGMVTDCLRQCLGHSPTDRPAVVHSAASGLAVVGTSFVSDDAIVGAAVAGYAVVEFCDSASVARLARQAGVPFRELWDVVRKQQPVPMRRLTTHGELLQVLGDSLLREARHLQRVQATATSLTASLAAKDEFLAVLSHELRSPLTPILGWTQVLQNAPDPEQVRRAAVVIQRNALLQLRLVDDLLELNRSWRGSTTLRLQTLELGDEIANAVDAIADTAAAKNLKVRFLDAPEVLYVSADHDRLQQVFRNVLLNAVKFTPPEGLIEASLAREDDVAVARIRDTGAGIASEFLPSAFEMFRQQDSGPRRTHGGLGIGLALVKGLVEAHGGSARIASGGVGKGTEVVLSFPIAATPEAVVVQPAALAKQEIAGARVLVVDDHDDARDLVRHLLTPLGARSVVARDGVEALALLALEEFDLVLCDLHMPRMDGFEFLEELKQMHSGANPPVIAVSALTSSADHVRTAAAGFVAHLDKPFSSNALLQVITQALARHSRP
jgi:signal transduction histidine kinase/ActR/RegA family two-component response regulator